jgi:hypothetical protein
MGVTTTFLIIFLFFKLLLYSDLSVMGSYVLNTDFVVCVCVQDELKVMEEVKAKQEKEDEKKCEESESGSVSLKSPGKVRRLY